MLDKLRGWVFCNNCWVFPCVCVHTHTHTYTHTCTYTHTNHACKYVQAHNCTLVA